MGFRAACAIGFVAAHFATACGGGTPSATHDVPRPAPSTSAQAAPSSEPESPGSADAAKPQAARGGVAYFIQGHGELTVAEDRRTYEGRSSSMARKLLERMKFTVKSIGGSAASLNEVPEDATLVLLLGPTASLSHSELEALERYMSRGGALFLALEAESPTKRSVSAAPFPNAKLARMVGMNFDTTLLASQTKHVRLNQNDSDRTLLIVNTFFSHASVFTLNRDAPRAAVVIFGSGSLESVKSLDMQVEFAVHAPDTFRDIDGDYQRAPAEQFGDFNLAAAVTRRAVARAFVVADSDAFSDFVMSEILSNQVFFVDAVKWLVGEER